VVQAKTGTLTGVHGLSGVLVTRQGAAMTFIALSDAVPVKDTLAARDQLDRIVATLAACGCR
jgi:D-alanyl-D-alanine carboxypeptidase/D-alanyl-D-alanine-endopeptidase (penicillin-binding protein 4)